MVLRCVSIPQQVVDTTNIDHCPLYLWMLTESKLHKILQSRWPAFLYRRHSLYKRNIAVASVKLNHPSIYFHQGTKQINQLYQRCILLHGDILYIPIEKYHKVLFQLKIRNGEYLCELLGVKEATYTFNQSCRDILQTTLTASDSAHGAAVEGSQKRITSAFRR